MDSQVIEGPWEEVARHADMLAGKRVRVTVLEEPVPARLDRALAELIEAAKALRDASASRPEPAPHPPTWGESVADKFRGQGFRL